MSSVFLTVVLSDPMAIGIDEGIQLSVSDFQKQLYSLQELGQAQVDYYICH